VSALAYTQPRTVRDLALDRNAIIEASAGTGKTYTIEHLVARLLLETCSSIDRILVVTFTEKATGELRGRIRGALERILRGEAMRPESDG
jgi:exodeoxyribonuclease V beta subunit